MQKLGKKLEMIAVLGLGLIGCASELDVGSEIESIIGGEPAADGEIPAMAYVGTDPVAFGGFFQWCGATVIAEHWVVTAAHCVEILPLDFGGEGLAEATDLRVITGRVSESDFVLADLNPVVASYFHPNHDPFSLENDIAVLRVAEPITNVEPMALMTARSERRGFSDGDISTVAGWGATDPDNVFGSSSRELLRVDVPVVNRETCGSLYEEGAFGPRDITEAMLCAGDTEDGGVDACVGDSGGPLFAQLGGDQFLGGVVSFGEAFTCGTSDFPGVYARVATLASWVEQCVADESRCDSPGSSLAPIEPTLECVEKVGRNRWRAHFGYKSDNAIALAIPRGRDNFVWPPHDADRPQRFQSGRVDAAFSVEFRRIAAWALTDPSGDLRIAFAHRGSPRCQ